jgi:diguanylate cyclase (GGDEF)-like protein
MVLREYFRILIQSLWLIIPMTMATLTGTLYFSFSQQPVYEASASYLIVFGETTSLDTVDRYYTLESFVGRRQLAVNFCSVIASGDNFGEALNAIGITNEMIENEEVDIAKWTWNCAVLPESSVLLVSIRGTSYQGVLDLVRVMGDNGRRDVETYYDGLMTFELIEAPFADEEPVSPNHIQNAVLGMAVGIVVSLTTSLLLYYFRSPAEKMENSAIRDPLTNAYNDRYFQKRLVEEVERSRTRNRPISVALLELNVNEDFSLMPQGVRDDFLHQAALYIQDRAQQGDIVAYRGDMLFEILLPETPGYEARSRLMIIHGALRSHLFRMEAYSTSFTTKIGIVESSGDALYRVDLLSKAAEALQKARESSSRHIHLVSTQSGAFVMDEETQRDLQLDDSLADVQTRVDRVQLEDTNRRGGLRGIFGGENRKNTTDVWGGLVAPKTNDSSSSGISLEEQLGLGSFANNANNGSDDSKTNLEEQLGLQQNLAADDAFFEAYEPSEDLATFDDAGFDDVEEETGEIVVPDYQDPDEISEDDDTATPAFEMDADDRDPDEPGPRR